MTTSNKKYDYAVFIGRFQPFHSGHFHVAKEALKIANKLIFVLGSHNAPLTPKNPYTTSERIEIINSAMYFKYNDEYSFLAVEDHTYNEDRWISSIQTAVMNEIGFSAGPVKIALVGYSKDHSSYYLKKFPHWDTIDIKPVNLINATDVRELLFTDQTRSKKLEWSCNANHRESVENISFDSERFDHMVSEKKVIDAYKKSWEAAPYPPTFVCVDAVVTQSGHVLLVQRRAAPGKGLWALPGGFVNPKETLAEATIRELVEETKIKVPVPVLAGSITKVHTYDAPDRSARGRTITQATHFKLNDMNELPKVKGSDDAVKAKWFSYSDLITMRSEMFEDHYDILEHMIGI